MRISDWSSDVCSSDLAAGSLPTQVELEQFARRLGAAPAAIARCDGSRRTEAELLEDPARSRIVEKMSRADFLQPEPVASDGDDGAARFRRVAEAPVRPRDPVAELDLDLGLAGGAGRADQARRAVGAAEDEEAGLVGPTLRIEEGERQEIGRAHV